MATEMGGYRDYHTEAAADTTHTINRSPVGDGHKIYVEIVGVKADRNDADCEIYLVTGGQQILLRHIANMTSGDGVTERVNAWLYTGEYLRFYWQDVQADDTLQVWILGVDKWEIESG
jgi:hypothetical protein